MGYRLGVSKVVYCKNIQETKLYGYVNETLKSAEFLVEKGYYDNAEILSTSGWLSPKLEIYVIDFREFAKLYSEDLAKVWGDIEKDWFINQDGVQEILKMKDWEKVVLEWG